MVAFAHSRDEAEQVKKRLVAWLAPRGLKFNEEKTQIVSLSQGFDFLGFNVRRYGAKLLIKPSKAALRRVRERLTVEMRTLRGAPGRPGGFHPRAPTERNVTVSWLCRTRHNSETITSGSGRGPLEKDCANTHGTSPAAYRYLTLGLCLFAQDDYEEVATKVTGSLDRWGCWNAGWGVPTASAITQARKRLGREVFPEIFERTCGPVGGDASPTAGLLALGTARGAWLRGWRLLAIDGFDVDVPDSKENAAEFGYAGSGANRCSGAWLLSRTCVRRGMGWI
jgi:hypothetical protein